MSFDYRVVQGDTLIRIAQRYGFSAESIYNAPENKKFRGLRPNQNVIYPGDTIHIPDLKIKSVEISTSNIHTFVLQRERELFRLKIQDGTGSAWVGKRASLHIHGQVFEAEIGDDGIIEMDLPKGTESSGDLKIYLDDNSDDPTHSFEIALGNLDPVETLSGIQARCNLLGYDCGIIDGLMGDKTSAGIRSFQETYNLQTDGVPGSITQEKLLELYGC